MASTDPSSSAAPPSLNGTSTHSISNISHAGHQRVLLLIAVQKCMLSPPPVGVPAASTVGPNIARILTHARSLPHPPLIIHVRNSGDQGEADEPGTAGWELVHDPLPGEPVIDKTKNNAFTGTRLAEYIRPDAEIVVAGMQSDFCVRATCSTALVRGNLVLLIRGAHATYDRLDVWNTGLATSVTPADTVQTEIEAELEEAGVMLLEMKDLPQIFTGR
ncbi:hypothetical protein EUX98_g2978 [Antrodiella citrinella]|uniref:Isochorismatase-like domain-containing protein n=1 Tax=Antrodiella citrinella TaxID=2447956 RepID=A0A4V3XJ08_9APHY|nr:hypothetical protein EUX98_g2978 [Antrodiella citrinella]